MKVFKCSTLCLCVFARWLNLIGLNFFIYLAQVIIGAALLSAVLRKFKQPSLFAYIIAGILLGPMVLGSIDFSALGFPFEIGFSDISPEIKMLAGLGTAFLLFSIGIETSIVKLIKVGKPLIVGTTLQILMVIASAIILSYFTGFLSFEAALFVGVIIASSSTMIVVKLLSDNKETNTLLGKVIISITLIQDFLILFFIPILANIAYIHDLFFVLGIIGKALLLVLIAIFFNRVIFPKLFDVAAKEQELFFLVSISTAFFFIGLGFLLDMPINITGFIGGLALSTLSYNTAIFSKIRALRDFFLTIFFVTLGAQIDFSLGTLPIQLIILLIFLIFIIKPVTLFLSTLFSGFGGKIAVESAFSLTLLSEFGFYLAALGLTTLGSNGLPIISKELFSLLVAITAFTMIITPYLSSTSSRVWSFYFYNKEKFPKFIEKPFFSRRITALQKISDRKKMKNHVVVIGGNVSGREVARKLLANKEKVLVIDSNPDNVSQGVLDKLPFIYGSLDDEAILEKADICEAKLVIITLKNANEAKVFTRMVKVFCKNVPVYVIATHFTDALSLYGIGADFVAMPSIMGANQLVDLAFMNNKKTNRAIYEKFRTNNINYIKKQAQEDEKYNTRLVSKEETKK